MKKVVSCQLSMRIESRKRVRSKPQPIIQRHERGSVDILFLSDERDLKIEKASILTSPPCRPCVPRRSTQPPVRPHRATQPCLNRGLNGLEDCADYPTPPYRKPYPPGPRYSLRSL